MRRYLEVWRIPGARLLILCGVLGRFPIAMVPLALLLLVEAQTGSYTAAGIATGIYTVSTAALAPVMGRYVDRVGPRPVLLASGIAYPILLLTLLAVLELSAPLGVVYAAAAVAGAAFPVLSSALRALWSQIAEGDDAVRRSAFALDSVTVEAVFVSGPVVVAAFVALASPAAALAVAAALCFVGTVTVALSGPTRRWRGRSTTASVAGAGPLRVRGMLVLLVGASAVMFGFGVMEVAVPAFAGKRDSTALSGVLLATWALGSCIGGIWFGTRRIAMSLPAQWRWGLLLLALGMAPLAFASNPWVLGAFLFVAGTAIAPMMTVQNGLVADLAPGGTTTEAFTWLTTVAFGASAIGAAVGGLVVDLPVGVPGAFVLASLSGMLAWTVALVGGRRLDRPAVTPPVLVAAVPGTPDAVPRELCLEGRR